MSGNAILIIFMVVAALATLGVLARGIIIMARGKDISGKQANKMMSYRVAFQALAIIFIIILFLINRPA
nr:twin transmembrane helix small protein [Polymorphobacter sp.]